MSCWSAASGWCSRAAGRSRTSRAISAMPPETLRKYVRQVEADEGLRPDLPTSAGARGDQARCARRSTSCAARTRSSRPRRCFSRPSSTQTDRSEPLHRRAPRPLRRRADLPDPGRVGVRLLPARHRPALGASASRTSGCSARIRELHAANYYAYGYRRMWKALRRAGEQVGRDRVKRLMRAHGIQGAKRRGKPWRTTTPDPAARRPPGSRRARLHRRRGPTGCGSPTSPTCAAGRALVFFAFVIDVYSRRIVGWQLAEPHAHRPRPRRAADGARASAGPAPTSSSCTTPTPAASTPAIDYTQVLDDHGVLALDRLGRRRLRQRAGRELRRHLQDRADRRPRLAHPLPARARHRRIRRLVQPRPPARSARRHPARRVRGPLRSAERDQSLSEMKRGTQLTRSP